MTASAWLTAWIDALTEYQTIAVVGLALVIGISAVRLTIHAIKAAIRP